MIGQSHIVMVNFVVERIVEIVDLFVLFCRCYVVLIYSGGIYKAGLYMADVSCRAKCSF